MRGIRRLAKKEPGRSVAANGNGTHSVVESRRECRLFGVGDVSESCHVCEESGGLPVVGAVCLVKSGEEKRIDWHSLLWGE